MTEKFNSILKTEVTMNINLTEYDDDEHFFKLRFDERAYNLIRTMLDTGAPVWFGIQKEKPPSQNRQEFE